MLHHVLGAALRPKVVYDEQVVPEDAVEVLSPVVKGRLHEAHDAADVGQQGGVPTVDDAVGDGCGHVGLSGADVAPQQETVGVARVERLGVAQAHVGALRVQAVVSLEGAALIGLAVAEALTPRPLGLLGGGSSPLALLALFLSLSLALAGDSDDERLVPEGDLKALLLGLPAPAADEQPVLAHEVLPRPVALGGERDDRALGVGVVWDALADDFAQFFHVYLALSCLGR